MVNKGGRDRKNFKAVGKAKRATNKSDVPNKKEEKSRSFKGGKAFASKEVKPKSRPDFKAYKSNDINKMDIKPVKDDKIRLNRYISNAGICSRREADELIKIGLIEVNGKIVHEMGLKVGPGDVVKYDGAKISQEQYRYVLLNKPKNFITTMTDDKSRMTVMNLVKDACKENIYPVGKLDRNTTGLMLFTNDGDLTKKLTSSKYNVEKLYFIQLAEKVSSSHLKMMREGINLDDGLIKADEVDYVKGSDDPRLVGIKVRSGRNRLVRRMFEYFGYTVTKLDRVMFAGLTKKDLSRGYCRHLTEKEVAFLKML